MLIGAVIGLSLFIVPMWAYRRGLQDGLAIKKDKPIEPIKAPIKTDYTKKKEDEAHDKMLQGLQNIMQYDGTPQEVKEDAR